MKKKVAIAVIAVLCIVACIIAYYLYRMWPMLSTTMGRVEQTQEHQSHRASGGSSDEEDVSVVYMTEEITPEGLMNAYQALGVELTGDNIGVKLSTGEPGSNYLDPDLIADLVHHVNGTIVECNTAYQGSRTETQMHYQVASDHGFTDIADFVIMDEDGSATIPVEGGARMTENLVGAHFPEYDGFLVLSHFKGHAIAGFGGAIKNISIGMAFQEGKCLIHTDGQSHTSPWGGAQAPFLECMAEAGILSSVVSGIVMSRYVFDFLPIEGGRSWARIVHMLAAYWGFVCMSLHLGVHWNMMMGMAGKALGRTPGGTSPSGASSARTWPLRIAGILVAGYGVYAFVRRGVTTYMFLRSVFVFFDYEEPLLFFYVDYIAVMGLFVWIGHYLAKLLRRAGTGR